jgi:hypothetical protein
VLKEWIKHALLAGRPFRSISDVIARHFESPGTKAYTVGELRCMFADFRETHFETAMTPYDLQHLPAFLKGWLPDAVGSFIMFRAVK